MLKLRGYDTKKYDNQNREELMILFQNRDKKITTIHDTIDILIEGQDNKIFVKYILKNDKTRTKAIEKYIESYYFEEEFLDKQDECIFITRDKLNYKGTLENCLNNLYISDKIFCQVICISSLLYDLTLNKLTPSNLKILSKVEKEDILEKYNIDDDNLLPKILVIDPIAIFYGVKLTQVVEITYPTVTNGISTYYRLCV